MAVESCVVLLDPEMAKELLKNNRENRRLRPRALSRYMQDLRAGNWKLNGESIKVSEDGTLIDGQHRCLAVVETGIPIQTVLTTGLPDGAFDTIDKGIRRTPGDTLSSLGEKNASRVASALRFIVNYDPESGRGLGDRKEIISTPQLLEALAKYPEVREATLLTKEEIQLFSPSCYMAIITLLLQKNPEKARQFRRRIIKGAPISGPRDPILILRNTMLREDKRNLSEADQMVYLISAWNAFVSNREVSSYRRSKSMPRIES